MTGGPARAGATSGLRPVCGATFVDPIVPAVTHICSRVEDHSMTPLFSHWDHRTDMTWPVVGAGEPS